MLEWTPERVAKFWDYESQFPRNYFTNGFGDIMVDRLGRHIRGRTSLLDYGCGMGFMTKHLLNKGYRVTGLDYSRDTVAAVNQELQGRDGFRGAFFAEEILAKGDRFDAILVFEVIEHLTDEYLEATMRNIKTLLAPGGVVIFTTPNRERLEDLHIFCPSCERVFHRWQHVRSWGSDSLSHFLSERGFDVREIFTTDFSIAFRREFRPALKYRLRKFLRRPSNDPHLACVSYRSRES